MANLILNLDLEIPAAKPEAEFLMTHIMGLNKWLPKPTPSKNSVKVLYKVSYFLWGFLLLLFVLCCFVFWQTQMLKQKLYLSSKVF